MEGVRYVRRQYNDFAVASPQLSTHLHRFVINLELAPHLLEVPRKGLEEGCARSPSNELEHPLHLGLALGPNH